MVQTVGVGVGVGVTLGGGGVGDGAGIPGGNQLPLTQVPPPRLTNGLGVEHPVVGVGVVLLPGTGMPGGNQLPLTQVPPPRETNGSRIAQLRFRLGVGVSPSPGRVPGLLGVVGAGIETPGGVMPGGYQLPFEHVPPPSETNGSGTLQVFGGGVGVGCGGVGVGVGSGVTGAGGADVPGGNQLPLTQVPPPRLMNGSGVRHGLGGAGVVGISGLPPVDGGGVGVGVGAGEAGAGGSDGSDPAEQTKPTMPGRAVVHGVIAPEMATPCWDQACAFVRPAKDAVSGVEGMTNDGACCGAKTSKLSPAVPLKASTTTRSETRMFWLAPSFGVNRRKTWA